MASGHGIRSRVYGHMSGPYRARFALGLLASKIRALLYPGVKIQLPSRRGESAGRPAGGREASPLAADDNLSLAFLSAGDERAGGRHPEDPHAPAACRPGTTTAGPPQPAPGPPASRFGGQMVTAPTRRAGGHPIISPSREQSPRAWPGRMTGRPRYERDGRDQRGASSRAWSRNDPCRPPAGRRPMRCGVRAG